MDRFRIISQLGAGGFGEAFRAWDTQYGVPVVLKRPLAKHLQRPDVLERFDREINRLSECDHPRIVPIVDYGHDSKGLPYLAMRFLPAGSLADRKKPHPVSFLHRWLPGVAAALDYVHARGIVHRDVKPANIFFDTESQAYLGDFGIAKVIDEDLAQESEHSLTSTGGEIGTYPYMGPEFFSQPRVLSGAYDQYALAITVYEMICGRRPFSGDSGQLIAAHLTQAPPDIRGFSPDAPPSLGAAVLRALAKKPSDRFGTCAEFAEAALRDVGLVSRDASARRFLCPGCHTLVKVPSAMSGRKCRCPHCSASLRVSEKLDALWLKTEDPGAPASSEDATPSGEGVRTSGIDHSVETKAAEDVWVRRVVHVAAAIAAAVVIMLVGLWIRSASQDASLAKALAESRWEDALSLAPLHAHALVGRARERIRATPADIEGAFADLDKAERQSGVLAIAELARAEAHAVRAASEARSGRLDRVAQDLRAAVRGGADQAFLAAAQDAAARAWLARAEQAAAKGDGMAVRNAVDAAMAAGASAADVAPLRARSFVCEAKAALKKGDSNAAVSAMAEASLLDSVLVQSTLANPAHAELRTAVVADYRSKFAGAVSMKDWERALQVAAAAETIDKSAGEWVATSVASLPPAALASLPPAALSSLPPAAMLKLPPAAILKLPPIRNSIGIELKQIPAGTFTMGEAGGSSDETPHQVTLTKPFYVGVHEVTNAQWMRIMGAAPSEWKDDARPVEQVSWEAAMEFCKKLSALAEERKASREYRLPTEAEWEYACRAGTRTRYSFGDDESKLGAYAWFDGNSGNQTHPVGQKKPNAWGLYDMHGNVWEWCSDRYGNYGSGAATDPQGASEASDRVFRGGGWFSTASFSRSAYRLRFTPSSRYSILGFRLALSPSDSAPPAAGQPGGSKAEPATGGAFPSGQDPIPKNAEPAEILAQPPLVNSIRMKLKLIPAGTFKMGFEEGEADEKPVHEVRITKPFYLGVYEVTNAQWQAVMGGEPPSDWKDDDRPVENVDWNDVIAFCQKLSGMPEEKKAGRVYRLPTEAEWEYACRAGTKTPWASGDAENLLGGVAWFESNSGRQAHPVGQKQANAWGLHDMHGNVWEWCSDWYGPYSAEGVADPSGVAGGSGRVSRGGCWLYAARYCRSAFRGRYDPSARGLSLGFRLALSPSGSTPPAADK